MSKPTCIITDGKYGSLNLWVYPTPGQEVIVAKVFYANVPGMTQDIAHAVLEEVQAVWEERYEEFLKRQKRRVG